MEQAKILLETGLGGADDGAALELIGTIELSRYPQADHLEQTFDAVIEAARARTADKGRVRIDLPGFTGPLLVRLDTSDYPIFKQVFLGREYDLPLEIEPAFILDGGANVGYASVYFAERFPQARILAVEPETSNFELLRENTAAYPQVEHLQAAIWHENAELNVVDIGLSTASYMVGDINSPVLHRVKAVCIDEIMRDARVKSIDILKLDIEGAEREVFSHNYLDWLGKAKVLIIELHEFRKEGTLRAFFRAIEQYKFEGFRSGENVVLIRR